MSLPYPDARSWAQDHSLASVPRLARLEGFALQRHPEIVETFGPDGRSLAQMVRRRRPSEARRASGVLLVFAGILLLLAPVIGVAVYGDAPMYIAPTAEPLSAEISVPISGVSFALAALTQLVCAIAWLRGGARWSPGLLVLSGATAVLAGFAAVGLPRVAQQDGFDLGPWLWPVWATLVVALPLALGILLRHRVRIADAAAAPTTPAPTVSDRERARVLARALPEAERRAVQEDRDDALRILADRGLLDAQSLERALDADLGTLFALDPIRKDQP